MSDEFSPAFSELRAGLADCRLPARRTDRPRRDGGRLPRLRSPPGPACRAEDPGPALAHDEAFRQRFIRESRAAAAVDHPHIIPVFDAGEANGVLFIAMRFVRGRDVRTLLDSIGPLPPARAAEIVAQVASALDAAHERGPRAPRRQAGEHAARRVVGRAARPRLPVRLRAQQAVPGPDRAHLPGPVPRHARLRRARADRGPRGRRARRPVRAGLRRLRTAQRRAPVQARGGPGDRVRQAVRASAADKHPPRGPAVRGRRRADPGHGPRAGGPVRDLRRVHRGPARGVRAPPPRRHGPGKHTAVPDPDRHVRVPPAGSPAAAAAPGRAAPAAAAPGRRPRPRRPAMGRRDPGRVHPAGHGRGRGCCGRRCRRACPGSRAGCGDPDRRSRTARRGWAGRRGRPVRPHPWTTPTPRSGRSSRASRQTSLSITDKPLAAGPGWSAATAGSAGLRGYPMPPEDLPPSDYRAASSPHATQPDYRPSSAYPAPDYRPPASQGGPANSAPRPDAYGPVIAPAPRRRPSRALLAAAAAVAVAAVAAGAFAALHHGGGSPGTSGGGSAGGGGGQAAAAVALPATPIPPPDCTNGVATAGNLALHTHATDLGQGTKPFGVTVTADGTYSFVSLGNGVAVLNNRSGSLAPRPGHHPVGRRGQQGRGDQPGRQVPAGRVGQRRVRDQRARGRGRRRQRGARQADQPGRGTPGRSRSRSPPTAGSRSSRCRTATRWPCST